MADVVVSGSADMLTIGSRKFYERAKLKAFLSIVYASAALFFLGLCCQSGGQSAGKHQFSDAFNGGAGDDNYAQSLNDQAGGFGFAAFCFFVAFALALSASLLISPFVPNCGNNNEARVLKVPQEV